MKNRLKQFLYDKYGGFADKRVKKIERDMSFRLDDSSGDVWEHVCPVYARVIDDESIALIFNNNPPNSSWIRGIARDSGGEVSSSQVIINVGFTDFALLEDIAVEVSCGDKPYYKWARDRVCYALRKFSSALKEFNRQ